jgi:hypothetical protein
MVLLPWLGMSVGYAVPRYGIGILYMLCYAVYYTVQLHLRTKAVAVEPLRARSVAEWG